MIATYPRKGHASARIDGESPGSHEPDRGGCEQEHRLQLDRPAALRIQRRDLVHVHEPDREQHVDHDEPSTDPRVETEQHQNRRNHLADVDAVRQKGGEPRRAQRLRDTADATGELADPVQEHGNTQHEPQDQSSEIVRHPYLFVHRTLLLWNCREG